MVARARESRPRHDCRGRQRRQSRRGQRAACLKCRVKLQRRWRANSPSNSIFGDTLISGQHDSFPDQGDREETVGTAESVDTDGENQGRLLPDMHEKLLVWSSDAGFKANIVIVPEPGIIEPMKSLCADNATAEREQAQGRSRDFRRQNWLRPGRICQSSDRGGDCAVFLAPRRLEMLAGFRLRWACEILESRARLCAGMRPVKNGESTRLAEQCCRSSRGSMNAVGKNHENGALLA